MCIGVCELICLCNHDPVRDNRAGHYILEWKLSEDSGQHTVRFQWIHLFIAGLEWFYNVNNVFLSQGVTAVKTKDPFKRNATFSTPIGEQLDQLDDTVLYPSENDANLWENF